MVLKKTAIIVFAYTALAVAYNNNIYLSLGTPGTSGLYYERIFNPVVVGIGPGLLFPLLTLPEPSYNPSLYFGYSVFSRSNFKAILEIHGMYFYKYDQLISSYQGEYPSSSNLRGDLILFGPDLAVQYNVLRFFAQVQFGTRATYHRWFGGALSDNFSLYEQMPSITVSGGMSF